VASDLLSFDELKDWLGYTRAADVERKLKEFKIPYVYGINGLPVTTMDAVNSALIGDKSSGDTSDQIGFG